VAQHLLATLGIYGGTLVVCFIAGIVQVINTEAVLLGMSIWLIDDPIQLPFVALCAAVGQMAANVVIFYAGRGVFALPRGRWHDRIERARTKIASWQKRPNLVLAAAAVVGVPPLVLVALVAGGMRIGLVRFATIGLCGRWLRFTVVIVIPWL
jgi:membrane protein YqaA with SNARE-associated domain